MKTLFPVIFLCFFGFFLKAQTNLDSLYSVWQDESRSDSDRTGAYKSYIWDGFLFSNPDTAILLIQPLLRYGEEQQYEKAIAMAYNLMGISNFVKADIAKSLDFYQLGLKVSEEIGDKKGSADIISNIGMTYDNLGDYPKALEYYRRSLKFFEETGNKKGSANAFNLIGTIFYSQGDYPKTIDYYQRSLKISEEIGDKKVEAMAMSNIGLIYQKQGDYDQALDYFRRSLLVSEEIGDKRLNASFLSNVGGIFENQGDYTKALDYYEKSFSIYEDVGDKKGSSDAIISIGNIHKNQGDESKALEYYQRSLEIRNDIGDKKGSAGANAKIGVIYLKQGDYRKAKDFCQAALVTAEDIGALEEKKSACTCLYDTYKAIGNNYGALVNLEKLQVIEDSLNAGKTAETLQQIEFSKQVLTDSLATAEKERLVQEAHLEEVRQKNQTRNMLAAGGLLILILAGATYSRLRYTKNAKNIIEREKDRSENLLLNILPADIAAELKEKGRAEARDFDKVSILFTDFKGFTAASEKLTAQELVAEINSCFEAFDGIMGKYKIEKIKTIGDAYMAAGGLPLPSDDSVKNTILAAIEMQSFIGKRKAEMDSAGKPAFEMRAGIHTGAVVAGIVGVKKFAYDIWGDTVNTASRMESSGSVGQVNISQVTYDLIKDEPNFNFESRGKIIAKGKGEIEMWFVSVKTGKA